MMQKSTEIKIRKPDDWHLHLRDGDALKVTVPNACRGFNRGIIMPNLVPPVTTVDLAHEYRKRIVQNIPRGSSWQPLMVLFLTDRTSPEEIYKAHDSKIIFGVKLYPAGATTNSDTGVTNLSKLNKTFAAMQEVGMVLQIHGEVTDKNIDIFDREAVFIETILKPLVEKFPTLKVSLEHITTEESVTFVTKDSDSVHASITPQHLLYNRNDMLVSGIRPHLFCLPILKRERHQQALLEAATSGNKKLYLGTDSAPHARDQKENCCGCAGCYSHLSAIELYAEVFDEFNALDKLEGFASMHGPDFYGLPYNDSFIFLKRQKWKIPSSIKYLNTELIPLGANSELNWKLI